MKLVSTNVNFQKKVKQGIREQDKRKDQEAKRSVREDKLVE